MITALSRFYRMRTTRETLSVFRWLADFSFTARKHWSNGKKLSFVHDLYLSHSSSPAYNLGSELASSYKSTHVFSLYFSTYESGINRPIISYSFPREIVKCAKSKIASFFQILNENCVACSLHAKKLFFEKICMPVFENANRVATRNKTNHFIKFRCNRA